MTAFSPKNCRAFTLLELMVVIAIISILAGFTAPQFTRQIAKAKLIEVHNLANNYQSVVEEFLLTQGHFPNSSEFTSITSNINNADNSIVSSVAVENPTAKSGQLKLNLTATTGIDAGQYFLFARANNSQWSCTSSLSIDFLPEHCSSIVNEADEE